MIDVRLAFRDAEHRLVERLQQLGHRIDEGDAAVWSAYCEAVAALAAIAPQTVPGANGELVTTRALAQRLGVSPKTILRKKKRGEIVPALQLGRRGNVLRWAAK